MDLIIPIFSDGVKFTACDIRKPYPKVLADAEEKANENKIFSAMLSFISGSITCFYDDKGNAIDNKDRIRILSRSLKYKCVEHLLIEIMLLFDSKDEVEGVYYCPRCSTQLICEKTDEFDNRDRISDLDVICFDRDKDFFEITLDYPTEIKTKKGEVLNKVNQIGFCYPTITDYIQASARYGLKNNTKLSIGVYANCMKTINGNEVDSQWVNNFGKYLLENLEDFKKDMSKIAKEINKYGIQSKIEKTCQNCNKKWKENLNTANFFVSALQLQED